jgi:hypothetical protein
MEWLTHMQATANNGVAMLMILTLILMLFSS